MHITCLLDNQYQLGESPVWHAREQALYWVDILAPSLNRLDLASLARHEWRMPAKIGCVALADDGGFIVALQTGLYHFNTKTERLGFIAHPEGDIPGNRYNDGKISPDQRFFVGTMDEATLSAPTGGLYRLDPDGRTQRILDRLIVSNGLAWSPDGKTMYHSDSKAKQLFCYDYQSGSISNPRLVAMPDEEEGRPDGGATDLDNTYWSAGISAGVLNAYREGQRRIRQIRLPCAAPTMPCFGGTDMKTLFITSSRHKVSDQKLQDFPLSGGIFMLQLDVPGVPIPAFPMSSLSSMVVNER